MYLLDTNVLSELRRPERAAANVRRWILGVPKAQLFISVISILEIELGRLQVARRDVLHGVAIRDWLEQRILPNFADKILPVDAAVARRCAALHVPDPKAERDAMIAATALTHGFTMVTRNVSDFQPMGVALLNPWDGG
jgi:toxin FitB